MPSIRRIRCGLLALELAALALITNNSVKAAASDVILLATSATVIKGTWAIVADTSAASGKRVSQPDAGPDRIASPVASPSHYFELTFAAEAGTPYRLWIRGKAQNNSYNNDSAYVQFSDSVSSSDTATYRIGTTSAATYVLEDCSGCGVSGWGWQDNGYGAGVLGPLIYFRNNGSHTIRIQSREDGLSIDQIILSPSTYLNSAPVATKNDTTILAVETSAGVTLVRQPYLQQVLARSAVIIWASRESGPASAHVGAQNYPALTTYFPASSTGMAVSYYQHEALITGLTAATTYAYRLYVNGVAATSGTDRFTTGPAIGGGTVKFIAFGDSGTGSSAQRTLASLMNGDTWNIALHAGDIAYGNTSGTGDASYSTYQTWFFDIYKAWLRRRGFCPSMGNHDARPTNNWGKAYLDLFVLPEDAGAGAYPGHAERYYSFDYGPIHFVALDTELAFQDPARRAAQVDWLMSDLSSTTQPWKVVYFHRSPYSSGGEHGSNLTVRQTFGPVFEQHGVQLAISAHEHNYERSVPWRASSDASRQAVTYIVTGGGGGPLYATSKSAWTAYSRAIWHYVRATVSECVLTTEAVNTSGMVFDRFTLDRCQQATDGAPPTVKITSPAPNSTVSDAVTVAVSATDDVRVEKVDLWIDGRLRSIDRTAPYSFTWNTSAESVGAHTLEARAYDIDGNRITSAKVPVIK
jgi:hypothetical protein